MSGTFHGRLKHRKHNALAEFIAPLKGALDRLRQVAWRVLDKRRNSMNLDIAVLRYRHGSGPVRAGVL